MFRSHALPSLWRTAILVVVAGGASSAAASQRTIPDPHARIGAAPTGSEVDAGGTLAIATKLARLRKTSEPLVPETTALLRELAAIGTTPAVKEMLLVADDHQGVFRPDVATLVTSLGDRAVPALIESKSFPSKDLHAWCKELLESMGKRTAGDAVQTKSNQVLADVLHAFAVVRELDAVPVVLSFVSSDRAQVRESSRAAIFLYGKDAFPKLREEYTNLVGRAPPEEWDEVKLAEQLFAAYDRSRLHEVYALLDEGLARATAAQGDPVRLQEAVHLFDKVLARQPRLDRRAEMIPVYVELAKAIEDRQPEAALAAYRKAQRLDAPDGSGPRAGQIASAVATLEASELLGRGVIDRARIEQAVALDPGNSKARALIARLDAEAEMRTATLHRWIAVSALVFCLLCVTILFARTPGTWRRRRVTPP